VNIDLGRDSRGAATVQVDVISGAATQPATDVAVEHRQSRRHRAGLAALATGLVILAIATVASAKSLGGITGGNLFTQIKAGPVLGVVDTFTGTGGSTLAGRTADTGQKWTVSRSTFALNAGGTALASTSSAALATAWVPGTLTAYTAQVDLTRVNTTATSGGLYLNVDATGLFGLAVIWQPGASSTGQIVFGKIAGGSTITVLDTHTGAGVPAVGSAVTLTVVCNGSGTYTLTYGAFGPYTVTLSAADITTYGSNKNVGVVSDHSNKNLYDNFLAKP